MAPSEALLRALGALALAKQAEFEAEAIAVYAHVLRDLEPSAVVAACEALAAEPWEDFRPVMPAAGVIRDRAEDILAERRAAATAARLLPMPAADEDGPRFFCVRCLDEPSGFRLWWCAGVGSEADAPSGWRLARCGRTHPHHGHSYVDRCGCVDTNPVIAQHRARMRAHQVRRASPRGGRCREAAS